MYTNQEQETIHFLLLIKLYYSFFAYSSFHSIFQAIALLDADQHGEANLLLEELTLGCPNADALACGIVQAYLRVQRLGWHALRRGR